MSYVNCTKDKYHNFKVLSSPYPERRDLPYSKEQVEECRLCGERKSYGFNEDGSMKDDKGYFLDHIRAMAQRDWGGTEMNEVFFYCNPGARMKLAEEQAMKLKMELKNLERDEHFKFAIKRALDDKDDGIKKR